MQVSMRMEEDALTFSFHTEEGEPKAVGDITMGQDSTRVCMPPGWSPDHVHPDLIGLATLLLCQPFTNRTVRLPIGVSPHFAQQVSAGMRRDVSPIDPGLSPREAPSDGVPGLNFSGGVDSFAALAVLPANTQLFFLDRVKPEGTNTMYTAAAVYHAIQVLEERHDRHVWRVPTDLEYLRTPVGFPMHISNAVPLVLLADRFRLNAQGWGTVLESAYRIGGSSFIDYTRLQHYKDHRLLFDAVGLPYVQSVAGVSEVGTTMIEARSPYAGLAQSCLRGQPGQPCLRCKKCFRKELLARVLDGRRIDDGLVDELLASKEVCKYVTSVPIKHENVVAYIMARYKGAHPAMRHLRSRVARRRDSLDWLARRYRPAADLLPETYRGEIEAALDRYMPPMTADDEERLRAWNIEDLLESRRRVRAHGKLSALLDSSGSGSPGKSPVTSRRVWTRARRLTKEQS